MPWTATARYCAVRFSDERLQEFHDRWSEHRRHVDHHIEKFSAHIESEEIRWKQLIDATNENAAQIERIIKVQENHLNETKRIIEAFNTASAGIRLLKVIGSVAAWLASLSIFVGIYHYLMGK